MNTGLDDARVAALEAKLKNRLTALLEEVRQGLARSNDERYRALAGEVHDLEDESVADLLVDVNLAEIDRDIDEIRQIEAALLRIRGRTFGLCVDCGSSIEYQRLEAQPMAARCRDCQEHYEKTHRDHRHDTL
jgi:RNA polymerase-binding protein DksA